MEYFGLLVLLFIFIQAVLASIKDIKFGKQKSNSDKPDEIEKKKLSLKRGIVFIILEVVVLLYFGILLIYFSLN